MPALEAGPYGRGGPGATQDDAPLATRKIRSYVAALMMLAPPAFLVLAPRARSFGAEATLYGVALGLFLWCVYGITYARMFRGRSTSLSTVMVLAGFSLGVVPASATALEQVNERFDDGPLETHEAKAQLKRPSKGPSYILVRGTWLPGAPTARYPDVSLVHTTNVEVPVHVVVKPGALGVPWIVSVTRATDQDLP